MTHKETILNYLSGKSWTNKGEIEREIMELSEKPCYGDTIARRLRELENEGKIEKRREKTGTSYQIAPSSRVSNLIKMQNERLEKEAKEQETLLDNLFYE